MSDQFLRLSRTVAHALRHHPERYGLELNEDGWAPLEALVVSLARDPQWSGLSTDDIRAMMAVASKKRYEIRDGQIRAVYGHSLVTKIMHAAATPPDHLYHGTSPGAVAKIRHEGLKPMRREYVHLSTDTATAATVARRRTATPVIISVHSREAHADGIVFHYCNPQVWLAEKIAVAYLAFPTDQTELSE
ncbi:MAG: RNA 2'-phosphotransferase [Rhodomicrobium sp.]